MFLKRPPTGLEHPLKLEALAQRSYQRIRRAALAMTGNPWDADDLAQETFLEATRSAERFAGRADPYTWLYAILCHRKQKFWCKTRKLREILERMRQSRRPGPLTISDAVPQVEAGECRRNLQHQVSRLPLHYRRAVWLYFWRGLTYEEVAARLACPIGTVKSRLHRALNRLRAALDESPDAEMLQRNGTQTDAYRPTY